jgi:hypothetical protein
MTGGGRADAALMKLTAHYLPFLKSAPPAALRALGLGAALTVLLCTGSAGARTALTALPLEGGVHRTQSVKRTIRCRRSRGQACRSRSRATARRVCR